MSKDNIFSGLRVVDLASFIAGPCATTMLADFGADVIKVEPPGVGDPHRHTYKLPPQSRPILERLVRWADVLVVNFPHPVRKRLKVTYEDVAQWNPRLIYADVTGYGDNGPDADLPGFDLTSYWARSGLLSLTRDADAPPTVPVAGSGDHA